MNQQLGTPCQLANLGAQCAKNENGIIAGNPGSIGKRIAATLTPSSFTDVDLNILAQKSEDDNAIQRTCLPVANIYVYCPPCACLISTAPSICTYTGSHTETFFEFYVRPDDRLISSCCPSEDRSLGLTSLVQTIKDKEITEWNPTYLSSPFRRLDRQWMEQRLFEIEETATCSVFREQLHTCREALQFSWLGTYNCWDRGAWRIGVLLANNAKRTIRSKTSDPKRN